MHVHRENDSNVLAAYPLERSVAGSLVDPVRIGVLARLDALLSAADPADGGCTLPALL